MSSDASLENVCASGLNWYATSATDDVMRYAFDDNHVPGPSSADLLPSTSRVGSCTVWSAPGAIVNVITVASCSGCPVAASLRSIFTFAAARPTLDSTTPHGAPAASLNCEYSLSRSTAQNSQPMLVGSSDTTSHAARHDPWKHSC